MTNRKGEKMKTTQAIALALGLMAIAPVPALAIDVEAGDYVPLPTGSNALALFYGNYRSDQFSLDGIEVPDSKLSAQAVTLQYNHYTEVFGRPLALQAYLPYGSFSSARVGGQDLPQGEGVGDLTFGATLWPLAADPQDLTGTTLGLSLYVSAPTGNYELGGANLGFGGAVVTPQIGLIQGLGGGRFLDVIYDVSFTRDFDIDGVSVEVDPVHQAQIWLRQYLSDRTNIAIGYNGIRGGETRFDGADTGIATDLDEIRLSVSHFLDPSTEIAGRVSYSYEADDGFANKPTVQLRFLKLF